MRAEQLTAPDAFHAEGPVWSPAWRGLRWVDMLAGDVLSLDAQGTVHRRHVGRVAAALRPREGGGAIIAVERALVLEGPDGALTALPELWSDSSVRTNDGGCDPYGRFLCGSMAYDGREGAGTLYRVLASGLTETVLEEVSISNGIDWSPDGRTAYYNDTPTQEVAAFDSDLEHGLTGRRVFATIDPDEGKPDGLTVDAEGGVWVALYGGSAVRRYGSDGELDMVVELPVTNVTACTFGGPELEELFITTSRENLPQGTQPAAGAVFVCTPGVRGRPARTFAG